jgi:glycosyltransferase involved in cell wall biosynthesis
LAEQFQLDPAAIDVVSNAPAALFQPLSASEQSSVRTTYNEGRPYFIYVGSLHPRKNIEGMLEAYTRYRELAAAQSLGACDLLIIGEGLFEEVRLQEDGVHLLGRKSQTDLARLVGAAQALLFLPHFEGFGVPVVEAFAAGTPVIASNTTSIPEVAGSAAAALVSPTDPEAAARAMIDIDTDLGHRQSATARGLARAAQFSWSLSAEALWSSTAALIRPE